MPKHEHRYEATDWADFLGKVELAKRKLKFEECEECFYRGHGQASWTLCPTLFRVAAQKKWKSKQIFKVESDLFWEFRQRAAEIHVPGRLDWDYLGYMRHHRVPTRILDWTEVLGVAVFFALERERVEPDQPAAVWLLNPFALNDASWKCHDLIEPRYLIAGCGERDYGDMVEEADFPWETPIALYQQQGSARMRAQRGWFTVHGQELDPLEKLVPSAVAKITLPATALVDARNYLDSAGVTDSVLFPDLDGLAKELVRKNRLSD